MALRQHLEDVLECQRDYDPYMTDAMSRRNHLVNKEIPWGLRSGLTRRHCPIEQINLRTKGRTGTGLNAQVPMVHVSDRRRSTTPNEGWYVVYLFAMNGSAVYASLNTRSTVRVDRLGGKFDIEPRPLGDMLRDRRWAREVLGPVEPPGERPLVGSIHLHATSEIANAYPETHVTGFEYLRGSVPGDEDLFADMKFLLGKLLEIYAVLP